MKALSNCEKVFLDLARSPIGNFKNVTTQQIVFILGASFQPAFKFGGKSG